MNVDHMSASLVNAEFPSLYAGAAGVVLRAETPLLCAWHQDVGTSSMPRSGCGWHDCVDVASAAAGGSESPCSWPPNMLEGVLLTQRRLHHRTYNEVIISSIDWQRALPRMIEAFVVVDGQSGGDERARSARAAFVGHFEDGAVVPILRYHGRNGFTEEIA